MTEMTSTKKDKIEGEPDELITDAATDLSALPALSRAEIDIQIATAKRWPRSIVAFKKQALELATLDEETAGACFYALPRDGKRIEGPSIRLAEIVASTWGNLRVGARILDVTDRVVIGQGACFDLEKNLAASVEVSRRITNRAGKRYSDDMVNTTAQAAMSIALRNAIFRVVPFAIVKDVYEAAKLVSLGKGLTMEQSRAKCVGAFAKLWPALTPEVLWRIAGKTGAEDIGTDELVQLRGLFTALKDGETSLEEVLRQIDPSPPLGGKKAAGGASALDALADSMGTSTHDPTL
jgi:hypothetical protein